MATQRLRTFNIKDDAMSLLTPLPKKLSRDLPNVGAPVGEGIRRIQRNQVCKDSTKRPSCCCSPLSQLCAAAAGLSPSFGPPLSGPGLFLLLEPLPALGSASHGKEGGRTHQG